MRGIVTLFLILTILSFKSRFCYIIFMIEFQVSSKGSLTGGYFNQARSRLEMQKTRSELMEQIAESEKELGTLRQELQSTESSINAIVSEMQKTETKQGKAK